MDNARKLNLVQGPAAAKPLPSGWDYAFFGGPGRSTIGTFRASSKRNQAFSKVSEDNKAGLYSKKGGGSF